MNERLKATDNSPTWRTKNGDIKISEMDNNYLQNALNHAQEKEFFYFNRARVFTNKINEILNEADKRGITLNVKTDNVFLKLWHLFYFKNSVKHKKEKV